MAVNTLPFVQVNLSNGETALGADGRGSAKAAGNSEPGLFAGLMAEYEGEAPASPEVMEQVVYATFPQKPVVLPEPVLDLLPHDELTPIPDLAEPDPADAPTPDLQEVQEAPVQAARRVLDRFSALLDQEGVEKLSSLLEDIVAQTPEEPSEARPTKETKVPEEAKAPKETKTPKPNGQPLLSDEAEELLSELAGELEPQDAEALRRELTALTQAPQQPQPAQDASPHEVPTAEVDAPRLSSRLPAPSKDEDDGPELEPKEPQDDALNGVDPLTVSLAVLPDPALQGAPRPAVEEVPSTPSEGDREPVGARLDRVQTPQPQRLEPQAEQAQRAQAQPGAQPQGAQSQETQPQSAQPQTAQAPQSQTGTRPQQEDGQSGRRGEGGAEGQTARTQDRRTVRQAQREDATPERGRTEVRQEARADFQSFFEGVLNGRRSILQAEPAPMSLTSNLGEEYTQAETLREGLVNVVRFARADGAQRASVIIDPPAIGRVSVELTSTAAGVEANIRVSSEQVRQLVQDQLSQLRMTLAEQGVQVAQFAVDVQQDDARGGRQNPQGSPDRRRGRRVGAIEETESSEEFRVDLEQGLLHWVA